MKLPGTDIEYILSEPTTPSKVAAIFLPGMSGGALDEKYEGLADILNKNEVALLRLQSWSDKDDLKSKSISGLVDTIAHALEILKEKGYREFIGIGKSFGASILLFARIPELEKLVLWAPLVHVSNESTFETLFSTPFSKIESWDDVTIGKEVLKTYAAKVFFIRGSEDTISEERDLMNAVNLLPNATLHTIQKVGHTPKNKNEWRTLFTLSSELACSSEKQGSGTPPVLEN